MYVYTCFARQTCYIFDFLNTFLTNCIKYKQMTKSFNCAVQVCATQGHNIKNA